MKNLAVAYAKCVPYEGCYSPKILGLFGTESDALAAIRAYVADHWNERYRYADDDRPKRTADDYGHLSPESGEVVAYLNDYGDSIVFTLTWADVCE